MAELRNTVQKQIVYRALCALDHPSATEVYDCVHAEHPTISRGTVFRVLSSFAETGKIRKVQLSDSDVRYDYTTNPHYHARCRVCGKVKDVYDPQIVRALGGVCAEGFEIDGCEVEFFGICAQCKQTVSRTGGTKE